MLVWSPAKSHKCVLTRHNPSSSSKREICLPSSFEAPVVTHTAIVLFSFSFSILFISQPSSCPHPPLSLHFFFLFFLRPFVALPRAIKKSSLLSSSWPSDTLRLPTKEKKIKQVQGWKDIERGGTENYLRGEAFSYTGWTLTLPALVLTSFRHRLIEDPDSHSTSACSVFHRTPRRTKLTLISVWILPPPPSHIGIGIVELEAPNWDKRGQQRGGFSLFFVASKARYYQSSPFYTRHPFSKSFCHTFHLPLFVIAPRFV